MIWTLGESRRHIHPDGSPQKASEGVNLCDYLSLYVILSTFVHKLGVLCNVITTDILTKTKD